MNLKTILLTMILTFIFPFYIQAAVLEEDDGPPVADPDDDVIGSEIFCTDSTDNPEMPGEDATEWQCIIYGTGADEVWCFQLNSTYWSTCYGHWFRLGN